MKNLIVFIYSIIHFVVDLSCAILVFGVLSPKIDSIATGFMAILLYDFFAFAIQFPIGVIADKINKNGIISAIGCFIVIVAYGFSRYALPACIIAGIGNALFHVGGGIDVLNISDKKATLPGIFVSTGAMGVFLGSRLEKVGISKYYIVIISLLLSIIVLLWLFNKIKDNVKNELVIIPKLDKNKLTAVLCLIITVAIRSYVGLILVFDWKNTFILAFISTLAVVFGKMLGGIIGDRIGFIPISFISLGVASVLFLFSFNSSIIGVLAILLFNMTMPITLTAIANILPNNKGMAFGLLSFSLFLGLIPVLFGNSAFLFNPIGLFTITAISTIILYVGIKKYYLVENEND